MNTDMFQFVTSSLGGDGMLDPELASAVQSLCEQLQAGRDVSDREITARFPTHHQAIRELLPTLRLLVQADKGSLAGQEFVSGQMLGEYRLLKEIGRGGMGLVYEAEQPSLSRRVAVKVLPTAMLLDERRLQRFQTEARAAAMLKHPHIVTVHAVSSDGGVHYYVMELIEGPSLAQVAERSLEATATSGATLSAGPSVTRLRSPRSVARLGIQAAEALHYAHSLGVIHRDIKPSNLLLDKEGSLHVADFGLARIEAENDLTLTCDLLGTLRYMSPEQVEKKAVDHRTDVYSLGLTLYECLSGKPAFSSTTVPQLSRDILVAEPTPLRKLVPSLPCDLAGVVQKAIEKDALSRYASAQELADDLRRFVEDKPVLARPVSSARRVLRWSRRNRSKATLMALATVLLLSLAIGGPWLALQQARSAAEQAALAEARRHSIYDRDMGRADEHIRQGEIHSAVSVLRQHLPKNGERDFRNFEWYGHRPSF